MLSAANGWILQANWLEILSFIVILSSKHVVKPLGCSNSCFCDLEPYGALEPVSMRSRRNLISLSPSYGAFKTAFDTRPISLFYWL